MNIFDSFNILILGFFQGLNVNYMYMLSFFQTSGLYEYKIYGVLDNVQPDICAQVYMDIEYRKQWDSYVNGNFL